jgi:hypothetical protein
MELHRTKVRKNSGPIHKLAYYFSSQVTPFQIEENMGLEEVPDLLEQAQQQGIHVDKVDLSTLSEEEQWKLYNEAITAAMISKCAIRQVFGSRKRSGWLFGHKVPALLVYRAMPNYPAEVYPCRRKGQVVTIREFLKKLLSSGA